MSGEKTPKDRIRRTLLGSRRLITGFSTNTSTLGYIVMFTVACGTFLMAISLLSGKVDSTKDVLPFATGLIGFLGGLVTAMFGAQVSKEREAPAGDTEGGESQNKPAGP